MSEIKMYNERDLQMIDSKLDEIEELLMGLPIRPGQKRVISNMIDDLYAEIEGALELSSVDYD
jgi:hypothetical protein